MPTEYAGSLKTAKGMAMEEVIPKPYRPIIGAIMMDATIGVAEHGEDATPPILLLGHAHDIEETGAVLLPLANGPEGKLIEVMAKQLAEAEQYDVCITVREAWSIPDGAAKTMEEAKALQQKYPDLSEYPGRESVVVIAIEAPEGKFFGRATIAGEGDKKALGPFTFNLVDSHTGGLLNFLPRPQGAPAGVMVH